MTDDAPARLRLLLMEAVQTLRLLAIHTQVAPASHWVGEQEISHCRLCGGADEHTPDCLIYRAERALEEASA